jgi:hypothetical protein
MSAREKQEALLEQCGAHRTRHSGRSLYHHLRGTEFLLQAWQCGEDVCLAGLFHSIYGTSIFRHASLQIEQRAVLVDAIGVSAERLVYLFHACDRPRAFTQALRESGSRIMQSRLDLTALAVTEADLTGLIEVECANLLEQGGGMTFLAALRNDLQQHPLPLSPALWAEHLSTRSPLS